VGYFSLEYRPNPRRTRRALIRQAGASLRSAASCSRQKRCRPTDAAPFPCGVRMRSHDEHYECAQCGAPLDIPEGATPSVMIRAASGEPNLRIILVGDTEVHRCVIGGLTEFPGS
jgi:hypothetical protein